MRSVQLLHAASPPPQTDNYQTDRQTDRQTNRQTGRQAGRQTNRQTDRQTDIHVSEDNEGTARTDCRNRK